MQDQKQDQKHLPVRHSSHSHRYNANVAAALAGSGLVKPENLNPPQEQGNPQGRRSSLADMGDRIKDWFSLNAQYQPSDKFESYLSSMGFTLDDLSEELRPALDQMINQGWYSWIVSGVAFGIDAVLFKILAWLMLDRSQTGYGVRSEKETNKKPKKPGKVSQSIFSKDDDGGDGNEEEYFYKKGSKNNHQTDIELDMLPAHSSEKPSLKEKVNLCEENKNIKCGKNDQST